MNQPTRSAKQLGSAIQRQRRLRGLSQSAVADLIGVGQKTISKIETGVPATKIDTIFAVLAALDLEMVLAPRSKGSAMEIEDIF